MRYWRYVLNLGDLDTQVVQCANSGLTTRTWALDTHFQVLYATFHSHFTSGFGCNLRCKWSRLPGAFKASATRCSPRQRVTLTIGNRDDGVVERRVDMRDTFSNVLFNF